MRLGTLVLVVWLIVGAVAAGQRHEFNRPPRHCSKVGTLTVTILAGPLNYVGLDPKISCKLPHPSK